MFLLGVLQAVQELVSTADTRWIPLLSSVIPDLPIAPSVVEGVIAEILLFAFGARVVGRLGPAWLIASGGLAGAIRWAVTGWTDTLPALLLVQLLHAFTFGAAHLGAIHYIGARIPPTLSATAQSLYSAVVLGLAFGLAIFVAGQLYGAHGAAAYYAMAALAGLGGVLALMLAGRDHMKG